MLLEHWAAKQETTRREITRTFRKEVGRKVDHLLLLGVVFSYD